MKTKPEKRSPLKDKPLRYAGQSIDNQIDDKRFDAITRIMMTLMLVVATVVAWFAYNNPSSLQLATLTVLLLAFTIIYGLASLFFVIRAFREINRLVMARDGEKIVAEGLQELIKQGATVLNDVQGGKFNIDHVIVSRNGIYLIETKTFSKPAKKEAKISFDNERVFADGFLIDRNPIQQAKALAKWLQDLLVQSTGIKFAIRPVVLFPGWFIEPMKRGQDVWILNPKALPTFISNEPVLLKDTDVHLVAFHLSRYVRTFTPKEGK
jgi:Nuclease-related domain